MIQEDKPVAEVLSTQVEAWQREVSALQEKIAFAIGKPVAAQAPVARLLKYIGNGAYPKSLNQTVARTYEELPEGMYSDTWADVGKLYAAPQPVAVQQVEEIKRLKQDLQLHKNNAQILAIDNAQQAEQLKALAEQNERMRKALANANAILPCEMYREALAAELEGVKS